LACASADALVSALACALADALACASEHASRLVAMPLASEWAKVLEAPSAGASAMESACAWWIGQELAAAWAYAMVGALAGASASELASASVLAGAVQASHGHALGHVRATSLGNASTDSSVGALGNALASGPSR
jgi:hypothetical protein